MQQRRSPPKHRHDGTSPLPLSMDWSPPPRKWIGRDTVWPHAPRTGWSYCVRIPSWVFLPKSRDSDPVVRRCSLEEWMTKLLSDIDISRSVVVASFLELEAAARSSFEDEKQNTGEANSSVNSSVSSVQVHPNSSLSIIAGSTSLALDYGSDTPYETSEIGTPSFGRDCNSEVGLDDLSLDEDLTDPIERLVKYGMSNIDDGLFMGQAILEQLEGLPRHKANAREVGKVVESSTINGDVSKAMSEPERGKKISHARKLSNESAGSGVSSLRGSESSYPGFPNTSGDAPIDIPRGAEFPNTMVNLENAELQFPSDVQLVLPLDHRQKMNRVLITMQQRLLTAKTDMEDLISRLNQQIAVKDYLSTKVKDLEVELETTKQKSKENLQQAILTERERFTQMQWDMEELRRKSLEMELKLKSQQDVKPDAESMIPSVCPGNVSNNDRLLQDLETSKQQLEDLQRQHQELEVKSKADIKVLIKEVKSLRGSQTDLKQQLNRSVKEQSEAERLLKEERQKNENVSAAKRKLLHECEILRNQIQECSSNLFGENEDKLVPDSSSLPDALDVLRTFDNQIDLLLTEAGLLAQDGDNSISCVDKVTDTDDDTRTIDQDLRKLLREIFTDNARLRKQMNSVLHYALKVGGSSDKNDALKQYIQNKSLER